MLQSTQMKQITHAILFSALIAFSASCGNSEKKGTDAQLEKKKTELQKLKDDRAKTDEKILALENEIAKIDTSATDQVAKLIAFTPLKKAAFRHYIELQGKVDDQNISYVTPAGQPGQIKAIYVKQGDYVKKGQLILKLDNTIAEESVNAIRQQLASVKAQLDLARSVYDRQKNLWDQHIGTEVQLLQAKTNVETLEGQLKSVQANINTAQAQANQNNVYSTVNGTVDEITAHVGETFNGNPLTGGYIKLVNKAALKISVVVPENYAGKVSKGSKVMVEIPDMGLKFDGTISFISQSVGTVTRGLTTEIIVPSGIHVKPNQIAIVKILDYDAPNSLVVPLNTVQNDENGKFVLVAVTEDNKLVARKRKVEIGQLYNDQIEIKSGLQEGDQVITDGFQGIFDGQPVTTGNQ